MSTRGCSAERLDVLNQDLVCLSRENTELVSDWKRGPLRVGDDTEEESTHADIRAKSDGAAMLASSTTFAARAQWPSTGRAPKEYYLHRVTRPT